MKRFHVNVSVADLAASISFYRTLFGVEPTVEKPDYAKWLLDDPRINFSISESARLRGVNHVGLQADGSEELSEIRQRLADAGRQTLDQDDAECCYARSTKTWVRDPDGVAWETFVTHDDIARFGNDRAPEARPMAETAERCCA